MTKHEDERNIHEELRRLLVVLVLGDAADVELDRLNDLLRSDSELRRRAARFLEEEAVLRHQFQILDRVGDYHTPIRATDEKLWTESACDVLARQRASKRAKRRLSPFLLLASALVVAIGSGFWVTRHAGQFGVGLSEEANTSMLPGEGHRAPSSLAMTESSVLPRVTRVSWSGPQFASGVGPASPTGLHDGVVPFTSVYDRRAEGYMVQLPPDAQLDLVVTADAEGENSLAVIEFDSLGTPTGRRISFSNSLAEVARPNGDDPSHGARTRFGPIGTWVERNNSLRPKYYCFISVHKLLNRSEDDAWHESRLSVQLEEPDLAHVGWDDSGMAHLDEPGETQIPDLDFDDLSATIRIHRPDAESVNQPQDVRVLPVQTEARLLNFSGNAAFPVAVGANEAVFVKVTNRFRTPTTIAVVEKNTGQVLWSYAANSTGPSNGGVCALENTTLGKRDFVILGRRPAVGSTGDGNELKPSIRFEQEAFVSLVFDEGPDDPDFDDVKVDIVTMNPL